MSKEAASPDLQAAAYWRDVVRSGRSASTVAVTKAGKPTAAAKREKKEPAESPRRATGLNAG